MFINLLNLLVVPNSEQPCCNITEDIDTDDAVVESGASAIGC
jgi:hypothetical protein